MYSIGFICTDFVQIRRQRAGTARKEEGAGFEAEGKREAAPVGWTIPTSQSFLKVYSLPFDPEP